jgi:hypothetical protein
MMGKHERCVEEERSCGLDWRGDVESWERGGGRGEKMGEVGKWREEREEEDVD